MKFRTYTICVGMLAVIIIGLTGCGIWPVMTEENGRRPKAMGKSDQVFSPWATQPVHLSEEYGRPYRYAVENQILNPKTANSLEVVEGLDGVPVQLGMQRYQKMFKDPPFARSQSKVFKK